MILERAEGRFSRVTRAWEGRTVVCIATGPSLSADQLEAVRTFPCIAVNDAYEAAPWAAVVYFADEKWWRWKKDLPSWAAFAGQRCSIDCGKVFGEKAVHVLQNAKDLYVGLSTDPGSIVTGSNSGYQAINIATLAGASRVILIGYDCRSIAGKDHYFGAHPDGSMPPYAAIKSRFALIVEPARAMGCEVLNATPGSAIECFPMVDLAESLQPRPTAALVPA